MNTKSHPREPGSPALNIIAEGGENEKKIGSVQQSVDDPGNPSMEKQYEDCPDLGSCKREMESIIHDLDSVEDFKSGGLICSKLCEGTTDPLIETSLMKIVFPPYQSWIMDETLHCLIPPPETGEAMQEGDGECTFMNFKDFIWPESTSESRLKFGHFRCTFSGNLQLVPPLLNKPSLQYIFNFFSEFAASIHLVGLRASEDPGEILRMFPNATEATLEGCTMTLRNANLNPALPSLQPCVCDRRTYTRIEEGALKSELDFVSLLGCCQSCSVSQRHYKLQSLSWIDTTLCSDKLHFQETPVPPEPFHENNWISPNNVDYHYLWLQFPHLGHLSFVEMDKWTIAHCILALQCLLSTKVLCVQLTKLSVCPKDDVDVRLIGDCKLYQTLLKPLEGLLGMMPLEELTLRLKCDVQEMERVLRGCRHTLRNLSMERPCRVECSLIDGAKDVSMQLFHYEFPLLIHLRVNNYYLGSLDDVHLLCPRLEHLRVDHDAIDVCTSYISSWRGNKHETKETGSFVRTCVLENMDLCEVNETVKCLSWNVVDIPFQDIVIHFITGFINIPRIFPNVTRLCTSIMVADQLQQICNQMTLLQELVISPISTDLIADYVITGELISPRFAPYYHQCREALDNHMFEIQGIKEPTYRIEDDDQETETKIFQSVENDLLNDPAFEYEANRNSETSETRENRFEPFGPLHIRGIDNLKYLRVFKFENNTPGLTNRSLVNGFLKLPLLHTLHLNGAPRVTITAAEIRHNFPHIMDVQIINKISTGITVPLFIRRPYLAFGDEGTPISEDAYLKEIQTESEDEGTDKSSSKKGIEKPDDNPYKIVVGKVKVVLENVPEVKEVKGNLTEDDNHDDEQFADSEEVHQGDYTTNQVPAALPSECTEIDQDQFQPLGPDPMETASIDNDNDTHMHSDSEDTTL